MAVPCPTPDKSRYATREAADSAATRVGFAYSVELRAYPCACTWYHLTSSKDMTDPTQGVTADTAYVQYVSALPDIDFREIAAQDATNKSKPEDSYALRHRINLNRWNNVLGQLINEAENRIGLRRGDRSLAAHDWRKRTVAYRNALVLRRTECKKLRAEMHEWMIRNNESRLMEAKKAAAMGVTPAELRAQAGEVAIDRLINAHGKEFALYLAEAYFELKLPLRDRITRYLSPEQITQYTVPEEEIYVPPQSQPESRALAEPAPGAGGSLVAHHGVADHSGLRDDASSG